MKSPKLTKSKSAEQLTGDKTPVNQFNADLQNVISKNNLMYANILEYASSLGMHDADLQTIEYSIVKMKMKMEITSSNELSKFKSEIKLFKQKLNELLKKMQPAHEENQKLAKAMESLTAETKIEPKLLEEMHKEVQTVNGIYQEFTNLMKKFQMNSYIRILDDVQAAITKVKSEQMYLHDATEVFETKFEESSKLCDALKETLDAAMKIHFEDSAKATKQAHDTATKVLHVVKTEKHVKKEH